MTLASLSPTQQVAPREDFDPKKVRALIADYLGIDVRRVTADARLNEDFGVDRLDRLELMILIEDKFVGAKFTDNGADQMELVSDLIRQIECSSPQRGHRRV